MSGADFERVYPEVATDVRSLLNHLAHQGDDGGVSSDATVLDFVAFEFGRHDPRDRAQEVVKARFWEFLGNKNKSTKDLLADRNQQLALAGGGGGLAQRGGGGVGKPVGGGAPVCRKCHVPGHALSACPQGVALNPDGSENHRWAYAANHPKAVGTGREPVQAGGGGAAKRPRGGPPQHDPPRILP